MSDTHFLVRIKLLNVGDKIMISKNDLPTCPVATTVGLIGNKWKILLLRDLLTGTKRYSDFQKSLPQISQKVLTQNLKSMFND